MSWLFVGIVAAVSANARFQRTELEPQNPVTPPRQERRTRPPRQYLATYFVDNGQAGVYLAISDDGFHFRPIVEPNVPILQSEIGADRLARDANIMFGPDRQWHMVWTSGWWDKTIGLAHSKDLIHWTQQYVPAMVDIPGALNAWAPEMVYDVPTEKFVIFWSSTVKDRFSATARADGDTGPEGDPLNHRFFFTTTKDFKSFSPSRLLWDPHFNCIDLTMHHTRDGWLIFGKNETRAPQPAKYLFAATAPSPYGPFHMVSKRITGDFWAEGPTAVRVEGKVRVYFDKYIDDRWGAVESTDLVNWTDVSDKVQMIPHARHGTVILASKSYIDRLRERLKIRH